MTMRLVWIAALLVLLAASLILAPPGPLSMLPMDRPFLPPSVEHPFGTDDLGRDLLRAVAQGGRTSLLVATVATAASLAIGMAVGFAAGLGSDGADDGLMRIADIVASLPVLILAILVAALFGGSSINLALLLGLTRWPVVARLVRADVLSLRRTGFIRAAAALGVPPTGVALRHILPHVGATGLSAAGILFGGAILSESALAFVGLGDPDATSWGQLVAAGYAFIGEAWWMWMFPAAAIIGAAGLMALATDGGGVPRRDRKPRVSKASAAGAAAVRNGGSGAGPNGFIRPTALRTGRRR